MSELFNGGELDAFLPSDSSITESTLSGRFDPDFARCAIAVGVAGGSDTTYIETVEWANQTEGYLHFDALIHSVSTTKTIVSLINGSGDTVVRLRIQSGGTYTLQYLDALSAWQSLTTITLPDSLQTFDLHWNFAVSGGVDLYVGGTNRITYSGDLSHLSGVVKSRHHATYNPSYWSQVMADTVSTIGMRLYTFPPTGVGATSSWTGAYTEIDETSLSDADFINSGTANQVSTFAITAGTLTGYVVQSVTVSARAKKGASGPSQLQLALRSSGSDYFSGSKALSTGYAPYQNIWTTNPATTAAWVNSAIASLQPGAKSIT